MGIGSKATGHCLASMAGRGTGVEWRDFQAGAARRRAARGPERWTGPPAASSSSELSQVAAQTRRTRPVESTRSCACRVQCRRARSEYTPVANPPRARADSATLPSREHEHFLELPAGRRGAKRNAHRHLQTQTGTARLYEDCVKSSVAAVAARRTVSPAHGDAPTRCPDTRGGQFTSTREDTRARAAARRASRTARRPARCN